MIISASRRTDIPAFFSQWFMNRLRAGFVLVPNPRNPGRLSRVPLSPDIVDCIVFWTKNPKPMLPKLEAITGMGYSFYFQFTLTPYGQSVETGLPPKTVLLDTFRSLSQSLGPERVIWRYDPIILHKALTIEYHLSCFARMCEALHGLATRCVFSFFDAYRHVTAGFSELATEDMLALAQGFARIADAHHLALSTCGETIDLRACGIASSACIEQSQVERIIGNGIKAKRNAGQRPACGCIESVDIGTYNTCSHGCTYCYATTSRSRLERGQCGHDPASPLLTGHPTGQEIITDRAGVSQRHTQGSLLDKATHTHYII